MSKKKYAVLFVALVCLVGINILIWQRKCPTVDEVELHMTVESKNIAEFQLYFANDLYFSEENSYKTSYILAGEPQELVFKFPSDIIFLRLDPGNISGDYILDAASISYGKEKWEIPEFCYTDTQKSNQLSVANQQGRIVLKSEGNDPYIVLDISDNPLSEKVHEKLNRKYLIENILVTLLIDLCALVLFCYHKKIMTLPVELWQNRKLIWSLAVNDFKTKYAGSYLGIVWAFIQPLVTIVVYWFVFSVGFKSGEASNYPFVLYLVSGIVPWFFFQDALNGGTNALVEYNYLVKKVVFKISILPIVKIISALIVHAFFVIFALLICAAYGYFPSLHTVQILYYSGCVFLFTLGLAYATSAIVIFFRDLTQIISIVLQVGIWLTPIMWDLSMLDNHPLIKSIFKLNPFYYIVSGYRDTMLGKVWLFAHWKWAIYFWVVTGVLFLLGTTIFKRLKPHFADVL